VDTPSTCPRAPFSSKRPFQRDGALWPGQFVDVRVILSEEADRVVAPLRRADRTARQYVFIVKDDRTVDLRPSRWTAWTKTTPSSPRAAPRDSGHRWQLRLVQGSKVDVKGGDTRREAAMNFSELFIRPRS